MSTAHTSARIQGGECISMRWKKRDRNISSVIIIDCMLKKNQLLGMNFL